MSLGKQKENTVLNTVFPNIHNFSPGPLNFEEPKDLL